MSEAEDEGCAAHYDRHLGGVYAWMVGGAAAAIERAEAELDGLGIRATGPGRRPQAVDLGAGFGAHAIPLARRGFDVLAVDGCEALLAELRDLAGELPIRIRHDEMVAALEDGSEPVDLLLCMGDTLTHLPTLSSVQALLAAAHRRVAPGGRAVFGFRDYASRPEGERAFLCVRGDDARIATCALEIGSEHVQVHDLLHERGRDGAWGLRSSSYRKLRLDPAFVEKALGADWRVERSALASGMTAIVAERLR